jgi:hypothetical protein
MVDNNKLNVNDSLLEYYTLKHNYEKGYYDKHIKPIIVSGFSKLIKKQKFQELKKPLCINCKQSVGTIFQRKYYQEYNDKPEVIVYTAKCGNILNPCDLNIEIHKSLRESYDKLIKENQEHLNESQMKIIKLKNKILFLGKKNINEKEYIDEFENYKSNILNYSQIIGEYTEQNIIINDNPEEQEKLTNLTISLNQQEIIQFNDYIKEYMNTNNDSILNNAINMYVNEIIPKVEEIRKLKYKTMYVLNDDEGNHRLIQSKYSPEGMNFYDEDVDEVVSFIKGSKVESIKKSKLSISETMKKELGIEEGEEEIKKSKTSKTLKNIGKTSKAKTQKKKLKISDENIIEEEKVEPEVEVEPEEEEEEEISFSRKKSKVLAKEEQEKQEEQEEQEKQEEQEISFSRKSKLKTSTVTPKKIGKNIILNEAREAL